MTRGGGALALLGAATLLKGIEIHPAAAIRFAAVVPRSGPSLR